MYLICHVTSGEWMDVHDFLQGKKRVYQIVSLHQLVFQKDNLTFE